MDASCRTYESVKYSYTHTKYIYIYMYIVYTCHNTIYIYIYIYTIYIYIYIVFIYTIYIYIYMCDVKVCRPGHIHERDRQTYPQLLNSHVLQHLHNTPHRVYWSIKAFISHI